MVYNHPDATALLKVYYRQKLNSTGMGGGGGGAGGGAAAGAEAGSQLLRMCNWRRDYLEAGTISVMQGYRKQRLEERLRCMREASTYFSQNPKLAFQGKTVDEQVELLKMQR